MAKDRHLSRILASLLPAGALGLSISLASADATAKTAPAADQAAPAIPASVALRLQAIRTSVSEVMGQAARGSDDPAANREIQLAQWGNGWRNGGWNNWGNGWRNGWANAVPPVFPFIAPPWGNGWHNGWHNGWRNW